MVINVPSRLTCGHPFPLSAFQHFVQVRGLLGEHVDALVQIPVGRRDPMPASVASWRSGASSRNHRNTSFAWPRTAAPGPCPDPTPVLQQPPDPDAVTVTRVSSGTSQIAD